jgi:hypothetical protein
MTTTQIRTFSTASNVRRFLKSVGANLNRYQVIAVGDRFSWEDTQNGESAMATYKGESETLTTASLGAELAKVAKPVAKAKPASKGKPVAKVSAHARYAKINSSSIEKPCEVVWQLADAHPEMKRAELIALCEAFGVAHYTARTQYQAWRASQS